MFKQDRKIMDWYERGILIGKKVIVWYGEDIKNIDGVYIALVVSVPSLIDREENSSIRLDVFNKKDKVMENIYLEQIFDIIE